MSVAVAVIALCFFAHHVWSEGHRARHFREANLTLLAISAHLQAVNESVPSAFGDRLDEVERGLEALPRKWDDAKRKSENAESRARYHASRAIEQLEEHGFTTPGLETVAGELFPVDAEGSGAEPVLALPSGVAEEPEPEDFLTLARQRKYGS